MQTMAKKTSVENVSFNRMDAIAKAATYHKKYNRRAAFDDLRRLAEKYPQIDAGELSGLYSFFMPPPAKRPKTVFDWVALAVGSDPSRPYLDHVYVDGPNIVATDGHRLHMAPNVDALPAGFYNRVGAYVAGPDDINYPDYSRVIPARLSRDYMALDMARYPVIELSEKPIILAYAMPGAGKARVHVNRHYMDAAISFDDVAAPVAAYMGGENDSMRLDLSGERLAVIMPIRY